jgi:hypothetical protein
MDNTERPGEIINRELYMITENEIQKTGSPSEGRKAHKDILRAVPHSHLAVDDVRSSSLTEPTYRIGAFYIYKYLPTPNPFVIDLL